MPNNLNHYIFGPFLRPGSSILNRKQNIDLQSIKINSPNSNEAYRQIYNLHGQPRQALSAQQGHSKRVLREAKPVASPARPSLQRAQPVQHEL